NESDPPAHEPADRLLLWHLPLLARRQKASFHRFYRQETQPLRPRSAPRPDDAAHDPRPPLELRPRLVPRLSPHRAQLERGRRRKKTERSAPRRDLRRRRKGDAVRTHGGLGNGDGLAARPKR